MATLTFELIQPFWLCAPQTNEYASVVPLTYLLCCEGPPPPHAAVRGGGLCKAGLGRILRYCSLLFLQYTINTMIQASNYNYILPVLYILSRCTLSDSLHFYLIDHSCFLLNYDRFSDKIHIRISKHCYVIRTQ